MSDQLGEAVRQAAYSQDGYKRAAARVQDLQAENDALRAENATLKARLKLSDERNVQLLKENARLERVALARGRER